MLTGGLNAANEKAVRVFLAGGIGFGDPRLVEQVMNEYERKINRKLDLETILAVDDWARRRARQLLSG